MDSIKKKILVDALYINNGGGLELLKYLISRLSCRDLDCIFLLDNRVSQIEFDLDKNKCVFLDASLSSRFLFYKKNTNSFRKVFCFGNIPPPLRCNCNVYVYFHNISLLNQPKEYKFKERIIKFIKGLFIKYYNKNTDFYIVQTNTVKEQLSTFLSIDSSRVLVVPFFNILKYANKKEKTDQFFYISNGNTHKNHLRLLKAWNLLANEGYYPVLHLTITDDYPKLIKLINNLKINGVNIINHGFVNPYKFYVSYKYHIYPSLCESFGLGLIESSKYDVKVLAPSSDYVLDVIVPSITFDNKNSVSIFQCVKRVLDGENLLTSKCLVEDEIDKIIEIIK